MCSIDVLLNSIFITLVQHRHLGFSVRFNQSSSFAGNQSSDMDHMVHLDFTWVQVSLDCFAMEGVRASPQRHPPPKRFLWASA
jgi:hypothetical protein